MKKQMKKLLALGLAFTTLTQIIQKAQAADGNASAFAGGGAAREEIGDGWVRVVDLSLFDRTETPFEEQLNSALTGQYTAVEQKALCQKLEAILEVANNPEASADIEPTKMQELLVRVQGTGRSRSMRDCLQMLNDENKRFVELGEVAVNDLSADDFDKLQDIAWNLSDYPGAKNAGVLQDLVLLDAKALAETNEDVGKGAKALSRQTIYAYRNSVVSVNFWKALNYFAKSNWHTDGNKDYFAKSFISFVEYVARVGSNNKLKLLEGDDGRQIPVSKFLVQGAPFAVPQQLAYAYALLNAGYDAPEFLIATAKLVEGSQENPMSKELLKLLVATILKNVSDTGLAKAILALFETREDRELFLLRYHVILAGTDQALARLAGGAAQRAYEEGQARLRAVEERRLAAWRTEEEQREAAQREQLDREEARKEALRQEALELQKALEVQREREIAQRQATAVRQAKIDVFRTKSLQNRRKEAATKIQQSFRAKKTTDEKKLNERADKFRAQKVEQANKAWKKATFDVLRNEVTERTSAQQAGSAKIAQIFEQNKKAQLTEGKVKVSSYVAGVRARVAERKEIERREKAATKIQQSFRAKKENERRKETLRIAQEREAMERIRKEELAIAEQRRQVELRRAALAQEEAALLKAQEEAELRRVRNVSGADALWGKKTATVAERRWADEVGLTGGGAAVRSVEDFVDSIAGALSIKDIQTAKSALTMRAPLVGMLASNGSFSQAVRELAALPAEYQADVWREIKTSLRAAGVNITVLASVKGIPDPDKAEIISLLQEGLKTE